MALAFAREAGNLNHYSLNAMLNVPLGQDLALRVTGGYKHDGDFVSNAATGESTGGGRAYNVRGKLRWNPGDADIVLGGQYYNLSNRVGLNTLGRNDLTCLGCQFFPAGLPANPGPHDYAARLSQSPMKNEFYGANLSMKFQVGDFELSSVTTYRHQKVTDSVGDSDFIPELLFEFNVPESGGKTFTQDFQISSGLDGRFNYLFGLSYLHDKGYFNPCLIGAGFGGSTSAANGFCADNSTTTKSYAAFVEGYYEITDSLKATLGGRYTYEQRSAEVLQRAFPAFFIPAFSISNKISQRAFTPRFVLAWNDGPTNIYYSFTRGFKAGGFPGPFFPGFGGGITTVQPEKIFSHEIGVKQSLLGNRIRLNAAAFYFKNKNQQSQTLDPLTSVATSRNSGAVENYGLEIEAQVVPTDGLTLGLTGAWQHARYKPFSDAALVCFDPTRPSQLLPAPTGTLYPCSRDITGTPPPHAPKFAGSFNANYQFPIASWTGSLSGIAQYTSAILYYPGASGPLNYDRRGELFLVNASGYVSPPGEHIRIGFYANNVFNKSYVDYRQTNAPWGLAFNGAKPRTYGLRVEYRF
ncbi:TonB-dependent receptor [Sphingobium sp. AN558]|uniref:TonB-dependent receptor n=1 Tax=Sphingobium sp. AN558 TaxID=3133442 RepID=UPI0030BF7B9A